MALHTYVPPWIQVPESGPGSKADRMDVAPARQNTKLSRDKNTK